jgi:drug/metabolite transporter (DMT)-like permease
MIVSRRHIGYILVIVSSFFTAMLFIITEAYLESVPVFQFSFLFYLMTSIVVLPYYLLKYRAEDLRALYKKFRFGILYTTFFSFIGSLLWFYLITQEGSTMTSLYEKFMILFSAVLGIFLLKDPFKPAHIIVVLSAFSGALMMSYDGLNLQLQSLLIGLSIALCWSFFSFGVKKYCAGLNSGILNFFRIIFSTGFFAIVYLFSSSPMQVSSFDLIILALSGLIGTIGATLCYLKAHEYLGITDVNALTAFTPIMVGLASYMTFGSIPSFLQVSGAAMVLLSMTVLLFIDSRQKALKIVVLDEIHDRFSR